MHRVLKSSVTDAMYGVKLSVTSVTSGLDLEIGRLHVFHSNDTPQDAFKQLEMAKVHQVMLRPPTEEDLPCYRSESTLRTHLGQTGFPQSVYGSLRSEVMQ